MHFECGWQGLSPKGHWTLARLRRVDRAQHSISSFVLMLMLMLMLMLVLVLMLMLVLRPSSSEANQIDDEAGGASAGHPPSLSYLGET